MVAARSASSSSPAWRLGGEALRVLVQAAPKGIEIETVRADLAIHGVVDVHDLHVWTLTSEMEVVTAHLVLVGGRDAQPVLDAARRLLEDRFHLAHATLEVEAATSRACTEINW